MASRSTELNLYSKVSTKIRLIGADIWFLKACKRKGVFPNFVKVNVPNSSNISNKVELFAKQKWLDLEIKYLYSKRSTLEIQGYNIFKQLTHKLDNIEFEQWSEFQRKMFVVINTKFIKKMSSLNKKIRKLVGLV